MAQRARRQSLRIGGQHPVGSLQQDDPRGRRVDRAELTCHRLERDLGDRTGHLDARGTATDDHERQVGVSFGWIGGPLGALERAEDPAADLECVLDGLQPGCVELPVVVPEVGMGRAGGEDEVVEVDRRVVVEDHHVVADAHDLTEQDAHVGLGGDERADRSGDVARIQPCGGHLVEQRLEQVVVAPVDEGDVHRRVGERSRRRQPAESAADDHDMRIPWLT